MIQQRGLFGIAVAPDEFVVVHDSEFKGAQRVAISVFNVAFPNSNEFTAESRGTSLLGRYATSAKASVRTTLTGVDRATQQRIADKAYALFVDQLKAAGFEVVENEELIRLAPEYATWEALPNFSEGRYGAYVAPTGRALRFLQGDADQRDTSGMFGRQTSLLRRGFDRPQAFARSPYIANAGNLGIIAVTLVVDYGVYASTGQVIKAGAGAKVGFKPGLTIAAGNHVDHGTLIEYWGPRSGGFPAAAFLAKPVYSDREFGTVGSGDTAEDVSASVTADPAKFEAAANEVVAIAVPKLVSVMAAAK